MKEVQTTRRAPRILELRPGARRNVSLMPLRKTTMKMKMRMCLPGSDGKTTAPSAPKTPAMPALRSISTLSKHSRKFGG